MIQIKGYCRRRESFYPKIEHNITAICDYFYVNWCICFAERCGKRLTQFIDKRILMIKTHLQCDKTLWAIIDCARIQQYSRATNKSSSQLLFNVNSKCTRNIRLKSRIRWNQIKWAGINIDVCAMCIHWRKFTLVLSKQTHTCARISHRVADQKISKFKSMVMIS